MNSEKEQYVSSVAAGKRRLQGSSGSGSNAKSRRREEGPSRRQTGAGNVNWSQDYARPQRDELLDVQLVDRIRTGEWRKWSMPVLIVTMNPRLGRSVRRVFPEER